MVRSTVGRLWLLQVELHACLSRRRRLQLEPIQGWKGRLIYRTVRPEG